MSDLVLSHLWLPPVRCRVLGLRRSAPAWDDCVQEGNLALLKAVERYDEARGTFEAYARPWVDNAIKAFFCAQQIVSEPVKRVSGRAARGELVHAGRVEAVEQTDPSGLNGANHIHREVVLGTDDSEELWHEALERDRSEAWLQGKLSQLTEAQCAAILAVSGGAAVAVYARQVGLNRKTVHRRVSEAMARLREASGG